MNIRFVKTFLISNFEFNGFWLRFHVTDYPDIVRSNSCRIQLWSDLFIKYAKIIRKSSAWFCFSWMRSEFSRFLNAVFGVVYSNALNIWANKFGKVACKLLQCKKSFLRTTKYKIRVRLTNCGFRIECILEWNSPKRFQPLLGSTVFIQLWNRINHVFGMCNVQWHRESVRILKRFSI